MSAGPDACANPGAVVDVAACAGSDGDPVRLIEVSASRRSYDEGHIPGACWWDWRTDLWDDAREDLAAPSPSLRAGRVPGAVHAPWTAALREDGTFRPAAELRRHYAEVGVEPGREVLVYCRSGKRSAHTWFVLTELLGHPAVRNYDASWLEWGSRPDTPIETGAP